MSHHEKTSRELEREIDANRLRIERKVDEITARLSPGQLLDEALSFTRKGPGADFINNFGRSVVNNPVPVALVGASLAWLFIRPEGMVHHSDHHDEHRDRHSDRSSYAYGDTYALSGAGSDEMGQEYPVAAIRGAYLRREGVETASDTGETHTSFVDSAGRKFKAMTDKTGKRAGHFKDDTGRMFRGFIDETGHRVTDFRDETDSRLHQAADWASHSWQSAEERASRIGNRLREGSQHLGSQAQHAGGRVRDGSSQAVHAVDDFIHSQPLVSGAIAFAIGAILAGTLPHTRQEDEAFGETADSLRHRAAEEAEKVYGKGREEAEKLHDKARETVSELHEQVRQVATEGHDAAKAEAEKLTRH